MTARVSLLGVVLLFLGNSGAASGAQAVFTRDGAQVYVISGPKREKLERVDLNERRISSVALPPSKGGGGAGGSQHGRDGAAVVDHA